MKAKELSNQRFGRLTALKRVEDRINGKKDSYLKTFKNLDDTIYFKENYDEKNFKG
jgi:hypothetical protein